MVIAKFDEAITPVCVGSVVLLEVFGSPVPTQALGGKTAGAGFGQRPDVMFAGFATPRPEPIGLPAGITLAAPASRRRTAMIGSSLE